MSDDLESLRRNLRDATEELERMKGELRVARVEVEEARSALTSFGQELRTPLNTIMGFSQLLRTSARDEDGSVDKIFSAGCQILALIECVLTARHQGDRNPPEAGQSPAGEAGILYIEDNILNYRLVERVLAQRGGITLFCAKDGEMALPLAREHRPALILLDLNLADMHGTEVLRRLREDSLTREIPVVIISADATPSQIEHLLAAGARNYLTKPFDIKRLLYTVDEILEEQIRGGKETRPKR